MKAHHAFYLAAAAPLLAHTAAAAAAGAGGGQSPIEEIVVTGELRDTRLLDSAASVSVSGASHAVGMAPASSSR